MRAGRVFLVLLVLAFTGLAAYFMFVPGATDLFSGTTTITEPDKINETVVGFVGLPYKDDYGMLRVAGFIDNLTGKKLASVQIEMQLIDDKGNKAEIVKYTLTDVPAKSRKTFDANAGAIGGTRNAEIKVTSIKVVN